MTARWQDGPWEAEAYGISGKWSVVFSPYDRRHRRVIATDLDEFTAKLVASTHSMQDALVDIWLRTTEGEELHGIAEEALDQVPTV